MRNSRIWASILVCVTLLACTGAPLRADSETPFLPTWKHLNSEQKRQFIAGYVFGWNDARKVTDIAIEYIRSNPKKAVESLESIKSLYDLGEIDPATAALQLDNFFAEPENSGASLSVAISALKNSR